MPQSDNNPITALLTAASAGDMGAGRRLWSVIYDELRRLARRQMANEGQRSALSPTALVHEAYFRLFEGSDVEWKDRQHFFGAAARAMRQVRIDDARTKNRLKRGGGAQPGPLSDGSLAFDQDPSELLAVDEALNQLEQRDQRKAEVVMLRYFVGFTIDETATALGISPRLVDKEWKLARAWLHRELSKGDTAAR
jgi:RNA polymerase sigma factor (TIGR02999 family)